ncbi:MAG: class 1 fructose-bisphosphatase [Robiginitomaculum sp.]|nr:MAG: class 1 fructose-bisphosphatase [Robiginitomaculum sp.]
MSIEFSSGFAQNLKTAELRQNVKITLTALAHSAVEISLLCARGPLDTAFGALAGSENADGDSQKALDVLTDEIITAALKTVPVAYYASEEQDDLITLDTSKPLAVASDPLDGSSNIDTNVSIGTIFSIFEAKESAHASFFRPGTEQLVGGFFVYGPQTSLVITTGNGTELYVLDRADNRFKLAIAKMNIVEQAKEYAINASNFQHWTSPTRAYIEECQMGKNGALGEKQNMRWIGSLVADANRILMRGGIFLYPQDDRKGYELGRLRLLYEAAPVAFIIEQAGGLATDGTNRILDKKLETLHERIPFVFGSKNQVNRVKHHHDIKT